MLRATTFHRKWGSYSRPVLVECDDGRLWVIKGRHNQRAIFNEQVVARLGILLNAPVPEVAIIELPTALKDLQPELADVDAGLAHGVLFQPDCTDREAVRHADEPQNTARFAALQVLYTWAHAGDHQLIYRISPPHLVYSVDHGHFFPSGPGWSVDSLVASTAPVSLDGLFSACGIATERIKAYGATLAAVETAQIKNIVSVPPDDWGVTEAERNALVAFLEARRKSLVAIIESL